MKKQQGFTLIELLIVIAIIAVLAGVVFVALNPLKRFQDARDSRRAADVENILSAIKVHQVDNGGSFLASIAAMTATTTYMIGTGSGAGCGFATSSCETSSTSSGCVDLSGLSTGGYIGSVPISPAGATTWMASTTGYTIKKLSNGIITISSCESEDTTEISSSK